MVQDVLNVLQGGNIPEGWNDTIMVLIPKVKNPEKLKDLRSISLCNIVYKLVSKVIANRLKCILGEIISDNQSAFVPGRLISDNTLLAYEMSHFLKRKRSRSVGYTALKLDMSKAYDRVEWNFLERILGQLGFYESFVQLISKCIRSVTYKFKVNSTYTDVVVPGRGLRQGDPISPYLFLLCAEGLSALLHQAEFVGRIRGIKVAPTAPTVTHLFFADDSLMFFEASREGATEISRILQVYEAGSGQMVNRDKSTIMFIRNTKGADKDIVMNILGL